MIPNSIVSAIISGNALSAIRSTTNLQSASFRLNPTRIEPFSFLPTSRGSVYILSAGRRRALPRRDKVGFCRFLVEKW
jgi:hypothetical protein